MRRVEAYTKRSAKAVIACDRIRIRRRRGRKIVRLGRFVTRRQYTTASVPDRFAKIQTVLDYAFQLLNLLV
jgi:hypothetical protein